MKLSLAYFDQSMIEAVSVDLWREIFDAVGWPSSLAGKHKSLTHADVWGAISQDDLNHDLLYALETLHTLGSETGREAIIGIMQERRVELQALPEGASEQELALRLYLGQRKSASLADVFARAQVEVQEKGDSRRYNEFLGVEPRRFSDTSGKKEALHSAVLQHCREADLGDHVQVDVFEDDGVFVFSVLRTDRMKKPLAVMSGQVERAVLPHRPIHGDLLRYEANLGRLRIAARSPSMVEFYRKTLGVVLFEDAAFFTGDPVCDLSVLQKRGRAAFQNHGVFGVGGVRMTECTWECGDRSLMVLRDADCFDLIQRHNLPLKEGWVVQAKLKVDVIGRSTRPVTVNIRVPSRIEVSQRSKEPIIDDLLDAIGIRITPTPTLRDDLWSLSPWRHPLSVWRGLFGKLTDNLVAQGALFRTQLDAVPHPDFPEAGNVLIVQPIGKGESQGVSKMPEIPSRSLSATDVEALDLAPEAFRRYLRAALNISSGGVAWNEGDEVLELGSLPVGNERLYVVYPLCAPTRNVADVLRAHAAGAYVVLLVPTNQSVKGLGATVIIDHPVPTAKQVIRDGTVACGIAETIPAIYNAPIGAELVVDKRLKKVWVHGTELQNLAPDSQAYLFIEMLASANNGSVSHDDITKAISFHRLNSDGTTTARQAKNKAKKAIDEVFATNGNLDNSDPFPSAGAGLYRCRLKSFAPEVSRPISDEIADPDREKGFAA